MFGKQNLNVLVKHDNANDTQQYIRIFSVFNTNYKKIVKIFQVNKKVNKYFFTKSLDKRDRI